MKTFKEDFALQPRTIHEEEEEEEGLTREGEEGFLGEKPMEGHSSVKCLANVSSMLPPYPTFKDPWHSGQKKAWLSFPFPVLQLWLS